MHVYGMERARTFSSVLERNGERRRGKKENSEQILLYEVEVKATVQTKTGDMRDLLESDVRSREMPCVEQKSNDRRARRDCKRSDFLLSHSTSSNDN